MKSCLPSAKSKDSSRVSAFVQSQTPLVFNITTKSKLSCASCFRSWPTGLAHTTYTCNNMQIREVCTNECTKNQVCKLFALTDGEITGDMSAMPQWEKLKNISRNY